MDKPTVFKIEKALDIKFSDDQKKALEGDNVYWFGGRGSGKTLVHCIMLALSDGPKLDITKPWNYCDGDYGPENNKIKYAKTYYRRMFYDVWTRLKENGFKVREIKE